MKVSMLFSAGTRLCAEKKVSSSLELVVLNHLFMNQMPSKVKLNIIPSSIHFLLLSYTGHLDQSLIKTGLKHIHRPSVVCLSFTGIHRIQSCCCFFSYI